MTSESYILQGLILVCCVHIIASQVTESQVTAPAGRPGLKGVPGAPGELGFQGAVGDDGVPGPRGEKGAPGVTGAPGVSGPPGDTGNVGATGVTGINGVTGSQGLIGEMGLTGNNGTMGGQGELGDVGRDGFDGPKGDKGARGSPGVQGIAGNKGEVGSKGEVGISGPSGEQGDKGAIGLVGKSLWEQDVDECNIAEAEGGHVCSLSSTICVNRATRYLCTCKPGYKPSIVSNFECEDINECLTNNGDCAGECTNTKGSFICTCPSGTKLTANNQCSDINECVRNADQCGDDPDVYCVNTYNSYSCVSSQGVTQETTTARAPVAKKLMVFLVRDRWVSILLAWLSVLIVITIVMLFWLLHVFHKMKKERDIRRMAAQVYDNGGAADLSDDEEGEEGVEEGMAGSGAIHIDIPHLPKSQRGTMKGKPRGSVKGSKSYKSGSKSSRPASLSSSTGSEMRTASVRQHRVATGERNSANRLSGVDTFY